MVTSGLVGFWPLSEWSGQANDLSGNDNHGTPNGGVTQGVAGLGGITASSLDGSDDYFQTSLTAELGANDSITFSLWFKTESNLNKYPIGARNSSSTERLRMTTWWDNGKVGIDHYDGTNAGGRILFDNQNWNDGNWHHLVGAYDSEIGVGNVYVDGELIGSGGGPSDAISTGVDYRIGDANNSGSFTTDGPWDGELFDVRVYNRFLSSQEVQQLYEMGSRDLATPPNASDPSAVSRYSFDDRSDTSTALDSFGSNDGAINGATYSTDSIRGLSMSFDGSNDFINAGQNVIPRNSNHTVAFWIKSTNGSGERPLSQRDTTSGDGFVSFLSSGGYFHYLVNDGTDNVLADTNAGSRSRLIADGSWNLGVATVDFSGVTVTAYINGVKLHEATNASVNNPSTDQDLIIGADSDNNNNMSGNIADFRVYDRILSDEEIFQLYRYGSPGVDLRSELVEQ